MPGQQEPQNHVKSKKQEQKTTLCLISPIGNVQNRESMYITNRQRLGEEKNGE